MKKVNDILARMDQYHQWWTGPDLDRTKLFSIAPWSQPHVTSAKYAIFTAALAKGTDLSTCSSPNDLKLFLGNNEKTKKRIVFSIYLTVYR